VPSRIRSFQQWCQGDALRREAGPLMWTMSDVESLAFIALVIAMVALALSA
jgi:hypothetical protein